jgi:iron(III) transport system ATP-binding protein
VCAPRIHKNRDHRGGRRLLSNCFRGTIESLVFVGEAYEGEIRIGETLLTMAIESTVRINEGDEIAVSFDPDHCFLISA